MGNLTRVYQEFIPGVAGVYQCLGKMVVTFVIPVNAVIFPNTDTC